MNQLNNISAGMKGGVVSSTINGNMSTIKTEIERLESLIKDLQKRIPSTGSSESDDVIQGVSIVALPESTIIGTSTSTQTVEIPIDVYYGNTKLVYNTYDDGATSFAVSLGDTNIYDSSHKLLSVMGAKASYSQLVIIATIQPSVLDNFNYEFEVIFNGVKYKKAIGINVVASEGQSALNIDLSPSTVIINETFSGGTLDLSNAYANYQVYFGSQDITSNATCQITDTLNCSASLNSSSQKIVIDNITAVSHEGQGCRLFEWTDLNGTQHSVYKATNGYVQCLFSFTAQNGTLYQCVKYFNFAVNYLGTFKESICNDIHTQVSEKVIQTLSTSGCLLTETAKTEIYQDAEKIALSAANQTVSGLNKTYLEVTDKIFKVVNSDISGNTAQISSNTENIKMALSGVSGNTTAIEMVQGNIGLVVSGLTQTGINITDGKITLSADTTQFCDSQGNEIAMFGDGGINTALLSATTINALNMRTSTLTLNNAVAVDGDGNTTVSIDGNTGEFICNSGRFYGVSGAKFYDPNGYYLKGNNFNISSGEVWDEDKQGWYPQTCLRWTMEDSGKLIRLTQYYYNGGDVGYGSQTFTAPSGMYFFENGTKFSSIKTSRELIEVVGYSSDDNFLGYIVLRRLDLCTEYAYGRNLKLIAYGHLLLIDTQAHNYSVTYKTFNDTTLNVDILDANAGRIRISWPNRQWFRAVDHVFVQVTPMGYINTTWNATGSAINNNCAKATVVNTTLNSFTVEVSDDATSQDNWGSFAFTLSNLDDWWYV